jgi:LPXTG-site transpeptidase (sortase) family protein
MNFFSNATKTASSAQRDILRGACYFFLALGILSLGYAGFVFEDSHRYQSLEMKKFEQAGRLMEPHLFGEGQVIGEIQVPRIGLSAIVVEGDSAASLRHAVGHVAKSALPGEWGNVALAGHRDTLFRRLRDIRVGDEIRFKTVEHSFDYVVESIEVVAPTNIQVLEATGGQEMTLVTCFPFSYVGPAPKRFIVRARQTDRTMPRQQLKTE